MSPVGLLSPKKKKKKKTNPKCHVAFSKTKQRMNVTWIATYVLFRNVTSISLIFKYMSLQFLNRQLTCSFSSPSQVTHYVSNSRLCVSRLMCIFFNAKFLSAKCQKFAKNTRNVLVPLPQFICFSNSQFPKKLDKRSWASKTFQNQLVNLHVAMISFGFSL